MKDDSPSIVSEPVPLTHRLSLFLTRLTLRFPIRVLVFFLLLLILSLWTASRLEVKLDFLELLPQNAPEVVDLYWMKEQAGGEGYLIAQIKGGQHQERLAFTKAFYERLVQDKDVRYAQYETQRDFFKQNALRIVPLATLQDWRKNLDETIQAQVKKKVIVDLLDDAPASSSIVDTSRFDSMIQSMDKALPLPYLMSRDKQDLYVLIKPNVVASNVGAVRALLAHINEIASDLKEKLHLPYLSLGLGGVYVVQEHIDSSMRLDLQWISIVSLGLSLFFLWLTTRRLLASFLILIPVSVAVLCALSLAYLCFGHLTIVSSLLVAILLGLGVEYGLHLIARTQELRIKLTLHDALMVAVPDTMVGALSASLTNSAAFLVLMLCQFKAFFEFGLIAASGVFLSWLFTYTLLPALIVVIEQKKPRWIITTNHLQKRKPWPWFSWVLTHTRLVVWVGIILGVAGILVLPSMQMERQLSELQGKKNYDPVGIQYFNETSEGQVPVVVAWVQDLKEAAQLESIFNSLNNPQDMDKKDAVYFKTLSLAQLVRGDESMRNAELLRIQSLLKRLPSSVQIRYESQIKEVEQMLLQPPIQLDRVPLALKQPFLTQNGQGTLVVVLMSVYAMKHLDEFASRVDSAVLLAQKAGLHVRIMSENRIASRIVNLVFKESPFIAWSSCVVVFLAIFLLTRNWLQSIIIFAPIALGMLIMVLGLVFLKIKLNFINIAVLPSIFTVAIDNAIHLYHRFKHEGAHALPAILMHTGRVVLLASCINAAGYGATLIADFYGLKSLGQVALMGVAGMVISTVFWFPAVLSYSARWINTKS